MVLLLKVNFHNLRDHKEFDRYQGELHTLTCCKILRLTLQSAMMVDYEPISIIEALKNNVWVNTMKEEHEAIEKNKTWDLIVLP